MTPNHKTSACYGMLRRTLDLNTFSGMTQVMANGHETWNMECYNLYRAGSIKEYQLN
jgi:hypothetical protein